MKKLIFLFVAVLGMGAANAQFEIEVAPGITWINVTTSGGGVSGEANASDFQFQSAVSYDFVQEGKLKAGLDLRGIYLDGEVDFMPGINIGHDNIYGKVSYFTDQEQLAFGVAGDIPIGFNLSLKPQIMFSSDTFGGNAGGINFNSTSEGTYATIGVAYKF